MQFQLIVVIVAICVAILFMARKILRAVHNRACDSCSGKSAACCTECRERQLQELKPR